MIPEKPYEVIEQVPFTKYEAFGAKLYLVNTEQEWQVFYKLLMQQKLVACDTETSGFHYYAGDRICGISFGWQDQHFYIPTRHLPSLLGGDPPPQLSMDYLREDLRAFFAQKDVITIWHNWKFDAHFYREDGIEILTPYHDTRIWWQFYDENAPGALKVISSGWKDIMGRKVPGIVHPDSSKDEKILSAWRSEEARERKKAWNHYVKTISAEYMTEPKYQHLAPIQLKLLAQEDPRAKNHKYANYLKTDVHYGYIPVELMTQYAALDTFLTWKVYKYVMENLSMTPKMQDLYINEIALSRVLMETEHNGILMDRKYLEGLRSTLDDNITSYIKDIKAILGEEVNPSSNIQLAEALLLHGCPLTKKTAKGNYSVDAKVLKKLAVEHDIAQIILDLRALQKLKSTYVEGILNKLTDDDILHCSFNQNVSTGRMSSRDPNLQNIPGRDQSIRAAFICPEDYVYVFLDYSQVEVRITADYSQDPILLDSYAKNQDVHTRTMCEMFGYNYDEAIQVLADEKHPKYKKLKGLRNISKRINFGIIYGVGAPGLSEQIPRPEQYAHLDAKGWVRQCQKYIDNYFDKYRGVKKFINKSERYVKVHGEVVNRFGRVRHLPHVNATRILKDKSKFWLEARAKRQGTNFLVQGTAADIFKYAVVRTAKILKGTKSRIVNFVHDEIQLYLHKSELHLLKDIKAVMEDFAFSVPIVTDIEYSTTNWADKKELK